jgi:hypothetical protein
MNHHTYKISKYRSAWPNCTASIAFGLFCLLGVSVLGTVIKSIRGRVSTPCLQPLLLSTGQATNQQQQQSLEQLVASSCNLTAALDLPSPRCSCWRTAHVPGPHLCCLINNRIHTCTRRQISKVKYRVAACCYIAPAAAAIHHNQPQ